jgi:hypothetical protein
VAAGEQAPDDLAAAVATMKRMISRQDDAYLVVRTTALKKTCQICHETIPDEGWVTHRLDTKTGPTSCFLPEALIPDGF